jgi:hypothetical protein
MKISGKDSITEKVEREGYVSSSATDWKTRAKLLNDPAVAIKYIAAILNRTADLYEFEASEARRIIDRVNGWPDRTTFNIRDQAGVLAALFQGGDEEKRAKLFEQRRTEETRFLNVLQASLNSSLNQDNLSLQQFVISETVQAKTIPLLPKQDKMGSWVSQYRWYFREYLRKAGVEPIGITIFDIHDIPSNPNKILTQAIFVDKAVSITISQESQEYLESLRREGKL